MSASIDDEKKKVSDNLIHIAIDDECQTVRQLMGILHERKEYCRYSIRTDAPKEITIDYVISYNNKIKELLKL